MRELLIATRNEGKIPGMKAGLPDVPFTVISLDGTDVPKAFVADEPGNTYEAHAVIKAILYGQRTGKLTIADDSGLEIDALGGWPGVHSATWLPGTDRDRLDGVLEKMRDIPAGKRGAQYRSVIAIYDPATDKIRLTEGVCRGSMMLAPEGNEGFGYDPAFYSDELNAGFGVMPLPERSKVSHRARALQKAHQILLTEFI